MRLPGHSASFSSHHSGNRQGVFGIGDHQVARRERIGFAIQREELLAFPGGTHLERAVEPIGIESVKRLAEFKHHQVGNIDDIINGTQSDRLEFFAKPRRTWADLHPANGAGRIKRAKLDAFHRDFHTFVVSDACASFDEALHVHALAALNEHTSLLVTTDAVVAAWSA